MSANVCKYLSVRMHPKLVFRSQAARLVHALLVNLASQGTSEFVITGSSLHEIASSGGIRLSRSAAVKGLDELAELGMIERSKIGHAQEVRLIHG